LQLERLRGLEDNQLIIESYLNAYRNEINASSNTIRVSYDALSRLSKHNNAKSFTSMTVEDIQSFLNSLKRPISIDPMHKSIGTYNVYLVHLVRFFKWLYYPEYPKNERLKPKCIINLKRIPRREKSIYSPSDLWTAEDDLLFLRYCPSKRIKCYHTVARDSSARPHEILKIKIKDLVYKSIDGKQYAEILVNGKTGSRHIPLINSLPYIKEYLMSEHPTPTNPNSALISGSGKNLGRGISGQAITKIYREYKNKYFPKLLKSDFELMSSEDKTAITELLKKPWNPYIRRHSALTDKSKFLKESILKSHAGWSSLSNMPEIYLHYFGNESSESILEAYGLKPQAQTIDKLKSVICPNCSEPNAAQNSKFCTRCKMILSYTAYSELQDKQDEISQLKESMNSLLQALVSKGVLEPTKKDST
jgi:integrase/recombinase XerD